MKKNISLTILSIFLFFMFCSNTKAERRIALVIGNTNYKSVPVLLNPIKDARDIADQLRGTGFDVTEAYDLNYQSLKEEILSFTEKIKYYDVALFYYAGHGTQYLGNNYLVPVDVNITYSSDVALSCVPLHSLSQLINKYEDKTKIIILDACRSYSESDNNIAEINKGFAIAEAPSGTLLCFSTSPGGKAYESFENGLYTESLLKYMMYPDTKLIDLMSKVRNEVIEKSNGLQVPWESTSLRSNDFILRKSPELTLKVNISEGEKAEFQDQGVLHAFSNVKDVSYEWYYNGKKTNTNAAELKIRKTGTYQAIAITSGGQKVASQPISVKVKSSIPLSVSIITPEPYRFEQIAKIKTISNKYNTVYKWYKGDKLISNAPNFTTYESGTYLLHAESEDYKVDKTINIQVKPIDLNLFCPQSFADVFIKNDDWKSNFKKALNINTVALPETKNVSDELDKLKEDMDLIMIKSKSLKTLNVSDKQTKSYLYCFSMVHDNNYYHVLAKKSTFKKHKKQTDALLRLISDRYDKIIDHHNYTSTNIEEYKASKTQVDAKVPVKG